MNKLWVVFPLLFTQVVLANTFEIPTRSLKKTMRDGVFQVRSSSSFKDVTLDCASFVHGIYFKEKNSKYRKFFYLYEAECNDLASKLDDVLPSENKVCLVLDYESHDYYLNLTCGDD